MIRKRIKARVMRDAEATHISLVDEPASRIPTRVHKRVAAAPTHEPLTMNVIPEKFRTAVAKRADPGPARPDLFAIVATKSTAAALTPQLVAAGINVDTLVENEHVTVFRQPGFADGTPYTPIALDDNTTALVAGASVVKRMETYADSTVFAENIAATGFMPSIYVALSSFEDTVRASVYSSDADRADHRAHIVKAATDLASYMTDLFDSLPESVFKLTAGQGAAFGEAIKSVTGAGVVAKIVQRPPETNDGKSKIDHSLAPNQQLAGAKAMDAEENPAQKQHAYNTAAALVTPEWPDDRDPITGQSDEDKRKDKSRPDALNTAEMHDTGRETSNAAARGDDSTFARENEPTEGSTGTIDDDKTESQGDYPQNEDHAGKPTEQVAGDEPSGTESEGGGAGGEGSGDAGTGGGADAGTQGAGGEAGTETTTTKGADAMAALIAAAVGGAMTGVVTKLDELSTQVGEIDARTTGIQKSHDAIAGTVSAGVDNDDPLAAFSVTKGAEGAHDSWPGLFDDIVPAARRR